MTNKRTLLSSADFTLVIAIGLSGFILAVALSGYLLSFSDTVIELYPELRSHAIGSAINMAIALVIVMALKLYVTSQLRKSRTL
ncbi:putative membrane protein YedE/YeeE [Rheinheimera pacifica]|uniref:hypothetical protein n=1 Tax=Rheinheimera pacifica TaxID=173990 RepID=UPI00216921B3|nr:hypothetical protein [Rheinheimera pacifica]MCS4309696.1 putative membrane protein YedE/YeeE [Rheinheimera pacifica]